MSTRPPDHVSLSDEHIASLVNEYFEKDRFHEFCRRHLSQLDEVAVEYFSSPEFDDLLVEAVRDTFPAHEHDQFVAHFRGILEHWVESERSAPGSTDHVPAS